MHGCQCICGWRGVEFICLLGTKSRRGRSGECDVFVTRLAARRSSVLIGDGGAQSKVEGRGEAQGAVLVSVASGLQLFKRQHSIPSGDARGRGPGSWRACGLVTFRRALAVARQDKNGEPTKTAGRLNLLTLWTRDPRIGGVCRPGPSTFDPHPQPPRPDPAQAGNLVFEI